MIGTGSVLHKSRACLCWRASQRRVTAALPQGGAQIAGTKHARAAISHRSLACHHTPSHDAALPVCAAQPQGGNQIAGTKRARAAVSHCLLACYHTPSHNASLPVCAHDASVPVCAARPQEGAQIVDTKLARAAVSHRLLACHHTPSHDASLPVCVLPDHRVATRLRTLRSPGRLLRTGWTALGSMSANHPLGLMRRLEQWWLSWMPWPGPRWPPQICPRSSSCR